VFKSLNPKAFKIVSPSEVEECINEALKGISDLDIAIYLTSPSTFCSKCGTCCRVSDPITISIEELRHIAFTLGVPFDIAKANFTKEVKGHLSLKTKPCIFLKNNKCSIYQARPLVCRLYPLVKDDKGNITLGLYPYCKVPVNIFTVKTAGYITRKIIQKTNPALDAALESWAKRNTPPRTHSQAEQIKHLTKLVHALQARMG